jgi:SAM-dependent methyltransferase
MIAARADIIEWDVDSWAPALDFWRNHTSLTMARTTALEIGSRHGGLSLWLALCGSTVVCSDVDGPTATAVRKHQQYGVSSRVTYEHVDALDLAYDNAFDLVVFKSVLGGIGRGADIERQRRAVRQMYGALKPGGELWFAENLVASPFHRVMRARYVTWAQRWRYVSIGELLEFLEPFASVRLHTAGVLGAFGRNERQRALLARADKLVMNALMPAAWRYIAIGVARKQGAQ